MCHQSPNERCMISIKAIIIIIIFTRNPCLYRKKNQRKEVDLKCTLERK